MSMDEHIFYIGGRLVSWSTKRQKMVATLMIEAEYIAIFQAVQQAM